MTRIYQVKTHCVEVSRALQNLARRNGWEVWPKKTHPSSDKHCPWVWITPHRGTIDWSINEDLSHVTITLDYAVEKILAGPTDPPIMIGEHEVKFCHTVDANEDGMERKCFHGIKVGCVEVSKETVDEIHRRLHEHKGESK